MNVLIVLIISLIIVLLIVLFNQRAHKNCESINTINPSVSNKTITKESYSDLLKYSEWQTKRQEILKRDNYKCCYCGSTNKLCVHHKYYLQYPNHQKVNPWDYPDDALITLCNKCHYKVHQHKPIKVYYKKYDTNS